MDRPVVFSNQNFVGGKAFLVIHPQEIEDFFNSPEEARRTAYLNKYTELSPATRELVHVMVKEGRGQSKNNTYDNRHWPKTRCPVKKRYIKKLHLQAELLRETEGLITPKEKALRKRKLEYVLPDPKMRIHASGFVY